MHALPFIPPEHGPVRPTPVHRQVARNDLWGRLRNRLSLAEAVMRTEGHTEPDSPRVVWASAVMQMRSAVDSEETPA